MPDDDYGYDISVDVRNIVVGNTDSLLLGADDKRIGVILTPHIANRYSLGLRVAAVLDNGLTIYPSERPVHMQRSQFGASVREEIRAIASAANTTVQVISFIRLSM